MSSPRDENLDSIYPLLEDLRRHGSSATKEKRDSIKVTFEALDSRIGREGCSPEDLTDAIELALSGDLLSGYSIKLFTMLYPLNEVPCRPVQLIVGSLGVQPGKPVDTRVQAAALKWLIVVMDWLDDQARRSLNNLYNALWARLSVESLRPHLPHLIALLTRREHVRPYRVSAVLTLQTRFPLDPSLPGLIQKFRTFYPVRIPPGIGLAAGKRSYRIDDDWKRKAQAIRDGRLEEHEQLVEEEKQRKAGETALPIRERLQIGRKKQRLAYEIPSTTTFDNHSNVITLADCPTVQSVGRNLDRLTLPIQKAALFQSKHMTWAFLANTTDDAIERIEEWLTDLFETIFFDTLITPESYSAGQEILQRVIEFFRYTKELLPIMEDILLLVIKYWDIGLYQNEIFELLSFFPPRTFEAFAKYIIMPLETKSLSAPVDFRIRLVKCYNTIMMRWSAYDWRSMRARRSGIGEIIAEVPDDVNWLSVASQFVDYVENYNTKLLVEYPDNIEIKHLILDSLEASTTFVANVSEFNLRLPDISLIFELLLGGDAGITSRTSGQICYWREVMTIHNELHAEGYVGPYPADFLDGFNHMVVNTVEMLYRMKGFTISDYGEWMGIEDYSIEKIAQEVESVPWKKYKLSLRAVCDIAFSPKFIALTQRFLIELQDMMDIPKKDRYVGPLTNTAIKGSILDNPKLNIRAIFLDWLAKKSVTGLPLLLFTSVNSLQYLSQQSGMGSSFYLSQSQSTKY